MTSWRPGVRRLRLPFWRAGRIISRPPIGACASGTAPAKDLVEASYALGQPDLLILAAEHHAIASLDPAQSLDLASWANGAGRYDLIARIDRSGTPDWRDRNPWLAMTLAQRSGDIRSALRYAAMLPAGRDAARESIIMASGNRDAIRRWLLERATETGADRPAIAQRLLEKGFRSDAIALLRQQSASKGDDASDARMLYLMGPRPAAPDLNWLKARATADPRWAQSYVERARPAEALAFLEGLGAADSSDILVQRIALANAARAFRRRKRPIMTWRLQTPASPMVRQSRRITFASPGKAGTGEMRGKLPISCSSICANALMTQPRCA